MDEPLSTPTTTTTEPIVVKMGELRKLGRGWIGGWKWRYFVLNSFGQLSYYQSEMEFLSNPEGNVRNTIHISSIEGMKVVSRLSTGMPGLLLTTPTREYTLEGETINDLTDWMHALRLVSEGRIRTRADLRLLDPNVELEEQVLIPFEMDEDFDEPAQEPSRVTESLLADDDPAVLAANAERAKLSEQVLHVDEGAAQRLADLRALEEFQRVFDEQHSVRKMQEQTLLRWLNFVSSRSRVLYLAELCDGVDLLSLILAFEKRNNSAAATEPGLDNNNNNSPATTDPVLMDVRVSTERSNIAKVQNMSAVLRILTARLPALETIALSASVCVSGNVKSLVTLLFAIAYVYQVKPVGVHQVILWVRQCTQRYDHVRITDLSTSFQDGGYALSALLHFHAPSVLDFQSLEPSREKFNLERVFSKANELFGVPVLLEASDWAAPIDEFSILLYLCCFYQAVHRNNPATQ